MIDDSLTKKYFNDLATEWDENHTKEVYGIYKILSTLRLGAADKILDLGCGTGILFPFLEKLSREDAQIYALDFARCMAEKASAKDSLSIQAVCGDAQYLPFRDNTIDRIIAFQVFPHIHDPERALKECRRVLKTEGELCIFHLHSSLEINTFHASLSSHVKHHKLPDGETMERMIHSAGFVVEAAVDQPGEYKMQATKK